MVQTVFRRNRQMKKDGLSMVMLPLLALLVAIQVTVACKCDTMHWELTRCPGDNNTVIMGGLRKVTRGQVVTGSAIELLHDVFLETVYKHGEYNLTTLPGNNIIRMITPEDCSPDYVDEDNDYMIAGYVDKAGVLHSNKCLTERATGLFEKPDREDLADILWGDKDPLC